MNFLKIFKRKSQKEDKPMTEDEKEIKKAEDDVAKKGKDSQSEKDRVDESVGEQERESGNENSQNAKDRVDESEGTKKADEERKEKKDEKDEKESKEDKLMEVFTRFESKLDTLIQKLDNMSVKEEVEDKTEEIVEEKAKEVYGLGNGVFQGKTEDAPAQKMTTADVAKILTKITK